MSPQNQTPLQSPQINPAQPPVNPSNQTQPTASTQNEGIIDQNSGQDDETTVKLR